MKVTGKVIGLIGVVGTTLYFIYLYCLIGGRFHLLKAMDLNNLGDFFAGVFGPLALFWLILGFLQQGIEIRQNTKALELQVEELKKSVEQQKELVSVSKQQAENYQEVSRFDRQRLLREAKPKFIFQPTGRSQQSGFITFRYVLKNVGQEVSQVSITANKTRDFPDHIEFNHFARDATRSFTFRCPASGPEPDTVLTVSYLDFYDVQGKAQFNIISTGSGSSLNIYIKPIN